MRIAIDATYSVGSQLTGVGVYSRELISALRASDAGAQLRLCFRPHRILRGFFELGGTNTRLLTEHRAPRCDLFHALNQRLPAAGVSPSVVTFHDLFVLSGEYSTPDFRARFTEQARRAAQRADLIIAVSRFTADQVRDLLGVPEARIRVVHHGTRPPDSLPSPPLPREPLILNVGALQKRKNIVRLVEAFEQTPANWRLTLVGARGFAADDILERIERSPRRVDISITGYLPAPELELLYQRASIFAFPSLDEGFGMPVLDAMVRGLPVLTSNRSALPEVAGEAALLVNPADGADVAAGLVRLCQKSDLRERLAAAGKARAAEFSWELAARRTWAVYRELV